MEIKGFIGDEEKQKQGVWVTHPDGDAEFLIAYWYSPAPRRFSEQQYAKNRRKAKKGLFPQELRDEIALETVVRHILKDWRGLTDNGEAFEYSQVRERELLTNGVELRNWIAEEAQDGENFGIVPAAADREEGGEEEEVSATKSGAGVGTEVREERQD